jgi:hypothetical protein
MEMEISVAAFAAPLIAASTFPQLAHPNRHPGILSQQLHRRTSGGPQPDGCLPYCRRTGNRGHLSRISIGASEISKMTIVRSGAVTASRWRPSVRIQVSVFLVSAV